MLRYAPTQYHSLYQQYLYQDAAAWGSPHELQNLAVSGSLTPHATQNLRSAAAVADAAIGLFFFFCSQ